MQSSWLRRSLAGIAAYGLLLALVVALPAESEAAPVAAIGTGDPACPHGANYTSAACFEDATHIDAFASWNSSGLYGSATAISQGGHINHALWTFSGSPCGDRFVEEGLTLGFDGLNVYTWYYARDVGGTNGYSHTRDYAPVSMDQSPHEYHLKYEGPGGPGQEGLYSIWRDGARINGTYEQNQGYGSCISSTGLEVQKDAYGDPPDASFWSDTFDATNLRWTDTGGTPHAGWNTSEWWIDYPCDGTNLHCFNGVYWDPSHWASNKQRN